MVHPAMLYEKLAQGNVHCFLCAHQCRIAPSHYGVCGMRQNMNGELYTYAYGKVVARSVDPVEKKPLFHVLPGSRAFSVATVGCNFACDFCQNWQISQAREAERLGVSGEAMTPEEIVDHARLAGCQSIAYTYTEPTIFFEYAYAAARLAREAGLYNLFVTNGFMTKEALETIHPWLDAANVDLKSFDDATYRRLCHGRLAPVLDTIRRMHELNIWVEVTTLVIPGQNDSPAELKKIAAFIAGVGPEIPWHVSRFHPAYRYQAGGATPAATLRMACDIGRQAGLRYVYPGNLDEEENTYCHVCNELLLRRYLYEVLENRLHGNRCPRCDTVLDGLILAGHPSYLAE
jgi:pyruvate formate lyase activating enzyme